jgi:hypothetical protein
MRPAILSRSGALEQPRKGLAFRCSYSLATPTRFESVTLDPGAVARTLKTGKVDCRRTLRSVSREFARLG